MVFRVLLQDSRELQSFSRADPPPISVPQLPWVQKQPLSPWLLIHIHGGGFVAQTSKSHEVKRPLLLLVWRLWRPQPQSHVCSPLDAQRWIWGGESGPLSASSLLCFLWFQNYLRAWSKELNVPILSVDYSLSPEAPFPRALEECFYAYCWALRHAHLLGRRRRRIHAISVSSCQRWGGTFPEPEMLTGGQRSELWGPAGSRPSPDGRV